MVVVFDLRLGKRGFLDGGPHHRTQAAVERPVQQELADFPRDRSLRRVVHRRVASGPITGDAQPLELGRLNIQPALGIGAALGPEVQHRHRILVAARAAVFFLHLPFDRQAMRIPARDEIGVEPGHAVGTHDHILQDAVQRVADVQIAIGIDGSVMQHEGGPAGGGGPAAVPQTHPLPPRQNLGLTLRQVAPHGERRGGEENGVAVVDHDGVSDNKRLEGVTELARQAPAAPPQPAEGRRASSSLPRRRNEREPGR